MSIANSVNGFLDLPLRPAKPREVGITHVMDKGLSLQQIEGLVDAVITELESEYDREVSSTAIGRKIMDRLEKLDEVAYVRFASVYRRFRDVNQFLSEVEGLIGRQ